MASLVRKVPDALVFALVQQHNNLCTDLAIAATKVHADVSASSTVAGDYTAPTIFPLQVTAANGDGTLPTLITLCQNLFDVYMGFSYLPGGAGHIADTLAHKAAWAAPALTRVLSTDTLATCETFLNALQTDYNSHRASTAAHYNADSTNVSAAAAASNQATSDTLAGDLKTQINAHIKMAVANASKLQMVAP